MSRKRKASTPEPKSKSKQKEVQQQDDDVAAITSLVISRVPPPLTMTQPIRLLVASIGNPQPYLGTLHSAGHTVIEALRTQFNYPQFRKSSKGSVSRGDEYTLFQSGAFMNLSGPAVLEGWRGFMSESGGAGRDVGSGGGEPRLVVLHDELDLGLGEVQLRGGELSPRGHNGLKSLKSSLAGSKVKWVRIGVGIGRPVSREPNAVAAYVLKKMTAAERGKLEACVGDVARILGGLRGES